MNDLASVAKSLALELARAGILDLQEGAREGSDAPILSLETIDTLGKLEAFGLAIDEDDQEISIYVAKRITSALRRYLPETYRGVPVVYDFEKTVSINPSRLRPRELKSGPLESNIVRCGDSIGPGNDRSAGTLGALVKNRKTGALFGLTCNHVIGGCNNMPSGMPIVSPGVIDVMKSTQKMQMIGRHARVIPLRQGQASVFDTADNIDAALFEIDDASLVSSSQRGEYDTPTTVIAPELGMELQKVGRTTDLRVGRIKRKMQVPVPIDYAYKIPIDYKTTKSFQGVCTFGNAWIVDTEGEHFAAAGDSGSLVVTVPEDDELPCAVGLLFAATDRGKGYMIPIQSILDAFNVELVSGHNL